MIIKAIELTDNEWDLLLPKIDEILIKNEDFTSPTYSEKGLKSINDLWILVKPERENFVELLTPLNINWTNCEVRIGDYAA